METIENEYVRLTEEGEAAWANNPHAGKFNGLPVGYHKIGVSLGSHYQFNDRIHDFFRVLEQIAEADDALTLVPESTAHFTFLALAGHYWNEPSELPSETRALQEMVEARFKNHSWNISDLRIVPGKNFLLLAGIPDPRSLTLRQEFVDELMDSPWNKHIRQRHEYKGYPFPPVIWHTTLCRYQHEFFPSSVRALYQQQKGGAFGSIQMAPPLLRAVNYDWSVCVPIA